MVSWPSPSLDEMRLKIKKYRSCSSSENLEEEVGVYKDNVLVRVSIFGSSFKCDYVFEADVS